MSKIQKKLHLGVYGMIRNGSKILLIRKSRGPYKGKWNLPGGKLEHGEKPELALQREVREETGVRVLAYRLWDNYSIVVQFIDHAKEVSMHHIGLVYQITKYDDRQTIRDMDFEDSLSAQWVHLSSLSKKDISPIGWNVISGL